MADDIDIEEHDVMDHPAIKQVFPDLASVKHEIMDFVEDPTEIAEESKDHQLQPDATQPDSTTEDLDTLLAEPIKIEDFDSYTLDEEKPRVAAAPEFPGAFNDREISLDELRPSPFPGNKIIVGGNKIILGRKPANRMVSDATSALVRDTRDKCAEIKENCDLEKAEIKRCLAATLVLKDWDYYLQNCGGFCEDCGILFPTVNSFDAHKMLAHSFLVAVQERSITPVPEIGSAKNVAVKKNVQCHICSKVFSCRSNLFRHYTNIHHCRAPPIRTTDSTPKHFVPRKQVARKHTAPILRKTTLNIAANNTPVAEPSISKNEDNEYKPQCLICEKFFANISNRNVHYRNIHYCEPPMINSAQVQATVAPNQVARKHTLKVPKLTIKIPSTAKNTYTIKKPPVVAKPAPAPNVTKLTPSTKATKSSMNPKVTAQGASKVNKHANPTPKPDMVCGHCNVEFPSKEDLINHLYDLLTPKTAANPPSYDCDQCNVKMKHKSALARHNLSKSHLLNTSVLKMKEKSSTDAPRQYFRCQICFFYIVNESDVKRHIEKYHAHVKNVKYIRSGFVPGCQLCNSTLGSYKFYNRHILNRHKRDNFKKTASADRLPKLMKAKPQAAYPTIGTGKAKGTMPTFATSKIKAMHQMAGTSKPKTILPTTGSSKPKSTVQTFGTKPKAAVPVIGTRKPKATAPTFAASKVKSKQFAPVNRMERIKKNETNRLLYMKNPPIPQTTLFKCPKCRTHFATHLSAYFHTCQCKGKMLAVFRCNKCNVIMKSHNKALHEKQHLFTDDFEIVTMSRDKKSSLKYLSNCPKCGIHFKEYKFWQHYEGCGRITHDSFYCNDCDLLIDASIKRAHKKLHQMGGEFKIFEYAAIDGATNDRIESKLAASAVKTGTKTINIDVKADETVPKVASHKEKRKDAAKGQTKVTSCKVKDDKVAPKTKDSKKKRSPLKRKRGYEYDENYTTRKKRKVVKPKVPQSKRYDPNTNLYDDKRVIRDEFKLRYCDTCHRFITLAANVKYHMSKACAGSPRPVICTHCGIALTSGPLRAHLKMHQLHKNLTLQDFEFYKLNSNKRIKPPLPKLMFCTNCKTYNKRRKLPGEKLIPHNCNEEKITCEICDIQLTEFAYGIHMSFHNYDVTGVKASEEMSEDVGTHQLALSNRQQTYLRTLYQCGVCDVMLTEKNLEQHKRFNDCLALEKGYMQCAHCKFSILGKDYGVHIRQHKRDPSFCKDNFTIIPFDKEIKATDDTNEAAKGKKFKVFICEKCELSVEPRSEARSHKCNKKIKTYYCPVCELNVQRPTHINRHRLFADFIPENTDYVKFSIDRKRVTFDENDENDPSDSDNEDDGKYRLYRCRNCEMCLELPRCAVKHIHQIHKCYSQKKRYVCPICEYQFFHFRVHARKHEQRPDFVRENITLIEFGKKLDNNYATEKTNEPTKKNATNSILLNLLQNNDEEANDEIDDFKLYACRKCNIKYYKPSVVKTHACTKNMIPYRCLQCRLTFDDVGYKTHILLHSKYPDYKGSSFDIVPFGIDPKSTKKPLSLIRPNVTRVPVASTSTFDTTVSDGATIIYKCLCGLHFLCRTTLDEHQTVCSPIHRAPGQCCTKCNLLFTPKSLYQHLIQHHGIKAGEFKYNIVEADLGANVNLKTLYKCANCYNHFVNKMILKDHYRANECEPDTSNQECPNCGLEFHYTNLVKHNQLHHGTDDLQEDDFEVVVLDKTDFPGLENEELTTRNNFAMEQEEKDDEYDGSAIDDNQDDSEEYNSVVDAADKTLYKCQKCEMHFMLESALEAHSSRECELSKQEECSTCGLNFALNTLRRHTKLHHEQLNLNVEDFTFKYVDETKKRRAPKKPLIPSENVLHKCKKCNIYFMSYRAYSLHAISLNRHSSCKHKLTCDKCDIVMPMKAYYKHKFMHHRLQNLTLDDITVKEYSNENELNDLMEYNMLISDEYYTKVLKTRYNHELHKCDKCNIHFMTAGALAVHVLKYEHKTPKDRSIVSCDHCGLAFLEQSLIRHKYVHHEKMRFKLSELEVKTKIAPKKNRREVAKLPQKLYKCGHCEIHFMNPNTCYRHVTSTHRKLKGMNCDVCKLKFVRRSLEKHMKAHHHKGHDLKDIIIEDYKPVDAKGDLPKIDIYMAEGVPLKIEPIKKEKAEGTERTARVRKRASRCVLTCRANYDNILFKCKVCDVYFLAGYSLEKHLLNHQGFTDPVRCEKCDIVLSKITMNKHNQMHHSSNNDLKIDDFVVYEFPIDNENVLHKCNKCNVYFMTFGSLDSHTAYNHRIAKTTVTCEKCHIDMTKDSLKKHMAQHHSPGNNLTLDDIFIVDYYKQDDSRDAEMETQDGETTEPDLTEDIRVTRTRNIHKRKHTSLDSNKPSKRMCKAGTETTSKQRNNGINETNDDDTKHRVPLRLSQIVTATINNKLIQPQTSALDDDDVSNETVNNELDIIGTAPLSLSQIARTAINNKFIQLQTTALDKDEAKTGAIIVDSEVTADKDIQSTSNANDKDIQSTSNANDKDIQSTSNANDKDIQSTSNANDKDIQSTSNANDKDIQSTSNANDKDIQSSSNANDKDIQSTSNANDELKIIAKVPPSLSTITTAAINNEIKQQSSVLESENCVINDDMNKTDEMGVNGGG